MKWSEIILELVEFSMAESKARQADCSGKHMQLHPGMCVIPRVNEELLQSRTERPLERKGKSCYCEM